MKRVSRYGLVYPYQDHIRNGWLFIHIPKCGGKSVMSAINIDQKGHAHAEYYHYQRANPQRFQNTHKFTVVRNPIYRINSLYHYMKKGGNGSDHDLFIMEEHFVKYPDIESFIMEGLTPEWVASWVMLRPQCAFIYNQNNELMVDDVLRLETLQGDFDSMCQRLGSKTHQIEHINKSNSDKAQKVFGQDMLDKIYMLYKRDFDFLYPDVIAISKSS